MSAIKEKKIKYALITGAAKRIGASISRNIHQAGYNVGIHYNSSKKDAKKLCDELNAERAGSAQIFKADITQISDAKTLVNSFLQWSGKLDLLINNASSFYPTPIGDITEENWNDLIGTNLKGPLFISQEASASLRKNKGSIINLVDIHIKSPPKDHAVYILSLIHI